MEVFNRKIHLNFNLAGIILVLLIFTVTLLILLFFSSATNTKANIIFGGLFTGFVVALFQFLLAWYEHKNLEKFQKLMIYEVRVDRDNRKFYEKLIKESNHNIDVMGVTASRFLEHFANDESSNQGAKVLIDALKKQVKVRILVPKPKHIQSSDEKNKAKMSKNAFLRLSKLHQNFFKYRYFNHIPSHSILRVDDKCIIGPVFPSLASKNTPCIFMNTESPYSKKYLAYFDEEWRKANVL